MKITKRQLRRIIKEAIREQGRRPEFVSFDVEVDRGSIPKVRIDATEKNYGNATWSIFKARPRIEVYASGIPSDSVVDQIEQLMEIEISGEVRKDLEEYFTDFEVIRDRGRTDFTIEDLGDGEGTLRVGQTAGWNWGHRLEKYHPIKLLP